ncbi:MAG: ADP-ribosylglycohydrolase family protein [Desulfovibrionaceae bacterium]|nr:ADP-ribosylglycohydrolase family protein [Desulfovibrionaceae bacterium]
MGRQYPKAGFGGRFRHWLRSDDPKPYESFGNGSAMRVSGCGYASDSEDVVKKLAIITSGVTHNHPEGLKGGEATAVAVYLARIGKSMDEIALALSKYYKFDFTLDDIRPNYEFDVTCQGTMPVAIKAFLESTSYEDAIRNAISVGGDSDTIGAITGAMAEAYFGIPQALRQDALQYIPNDLLEILQAFEEKYPPKII